MFSIIFDFMTKNGNKPYNYLLAEDSEWLSMCGAVSMIGILAGIMYACLFILIPAIAIAVYTVVYSYVEFERERKTGAGK
jgi:hypothetical protein